MDSAACGLQTHTPVINAVHCKRVKQTVLTGHQHLIFNHRTQIYHKSGIYMLANNKVGRQRGEKTFKAYFNHMLFFSMAELAGLRHFGGRIQWSHGWENGKLQPQWSSFHKVNLVRLFHSFLTLTDLFWWVRRCVLVSPTFLFRALSFSTTPSSSDTTESTTGKLLSVFSSSATTMVTWLVSRSMFFWAALKRLFRVS